MKLRRVWFIVLLTNVIFAGIYTWHWYNTPLPNIICEYEYGHRTTREAIGIGYGVCVLAIMLSVETLWNWAERKYNANVSNST
jgi:uncharacterized membrane protein